MSTASSSSRRNFLKTGAAGAAALTLSQVPFVHAQGNDTIRIGLVGCGGRGTGAAAQALRADPGVRLVAMADAFRDRLEGSLASLTNDQALREKIDVPRERQFVGFDAAERLIDSDIQVVLLCTPPHFRPAHIRAAVAARKHIFAEKPVAVDGPGVRAVLRACEEARERRLSIVAGFCWRYHAAMRQTVERIHDGAIGNIAAMQCTYNTGLLWSHARRQNWSDMEWQMRNWLYFTWLSGDFNVEQHCHSLDKMAWVMANHYPTRCYGVGGRQVRTAPEFGHAYDHMAVTYDFAIPQGVGNGVRATDADGVVRCFSMCRQMAGCSNDVSDWIMGTRGTATLSHSQPNLGFKINGERAWQAVRNDRNDDMYQREHNELFAAIRAGNPINNGDWMAKSSLMAIMGRMACYTGQTITWEAALNSEERLGPERYEWGNLAVPPVARPGRQ